MTGNANAPRVRLRRIVLVFGDCEICAEGALKSASHCTMRGGFRVQACSDCANAWHEYAVEHPDMQRLDQIEDEQEELGTLALASSRSDERAATYAAKAKSLSQEKTAVSRRLYDVGKMWCAERRAQLAPHPTKRRAQLAPHPTTNQ